MIWPLRFTGFTSCLWLMAAGCVVPAPVPPARPAGVAQPVAEARDAPTATADPEHDPRQWFPFGARGADSPDGLIDLSALGDSPAGGGGVGAPPGGGFLGGAWVRARPGGAFRRWRGAADPFFRRQLHCHGLLSDARDGAARGGAAGASG